MGVLPVRFPRKKGKKTESLRTGSVGWQAVPALIERRAVADVGDGSISSPGIDEVDRFDSMNLRWESQAYRSLRRPVL